nr:MAG: hypothetical protein [Metapenaeus ensis nimavirus]
MVKDFEFQSSFNSYVRIFGGPPSEGRPLSKGIRVLDLSNVSPLVATYVGDTCRGQQRLTALLQAPTSSSAIPNAPTFESSSCQDTG